ncbi:putative chromate transport protein [bioreactor metagenome]|uniref:Putative chromate transport protein n=1 Tax=bioreactor metagenome TaxID=1076179 RepID=A0A645DQU3_9ZZZZ|nr:chromate transporter [Proteiniphilum sp.]MEA4917572.1 chromate transporter [Proteiniphilum sp.]
MELLGLYLSLFISFFKIGLFGFGGGYAMLPLIQHEVVDMHQWVSVSDFTDIIAISQTTPGAIAFNSATFIGYTSVMNLGYASGFGILGSAICTLSISLPSLILMTLVTAFFLRLKKNPWMQASLSVLKPAIIGLIASAALILMTPHNFTDYKSWFIFAGVLVASIKKVDPILLIFLSGLAGFIFY